MKNLGKYVMLFLVGCSLLQAGSLRAFVSDSDIEPGESVVLHIKAQGDDIEFPTIEKIGDYRVKSGLSKTGYSINSINGQTSSIKEESRSLIFTPDKDMTIPPIEVKVDGKILKSDPIKITLSKKSVTPPANTDNTSIATLSLLPSKSEMYAGESIIATLYFRYRRDADIVKSEYQKPSFDGFLAKEIGGVQEYRDGEYDVKELNYALTPLDSGKIDVEPAKLRFSRYVQSNTHDMFDMFYKKAVAKTIASKPFSVDVKPLSKDFDLVGDFELKATINKSEVGANKPVELDIVLEGYGAIDTLDLSKFDALSGIAFYKDEPVKKESIKDGRLYTSYHQKVVFVSDRDFTIPSLELSLFEPQKGTDKTLKTEQFSIKVKGGVASIASQAAGTEQKTVQVEPQNTPSTPKKTEKSETAKQAYWLYFAIFISGVIIGVLALLLFRFIRAKKSDMMSSDDLLSKLYPYISKDKEVEALVRELYAKKAGDKSIKIDKKRIKQVLANLKKYQ